MRARRFGRFSALINYPVARIVDLWGREIAFLSEDRPFDCCGDLTIVS